MLQRTLVYGVPTVSKRLSGFPCCPFLIPPFPDLCTRREAKKGLSLMSPSWMGQRLVLLSESFQYVSGLCASKLDVQYVFNWICDYPAGWSHWLGAEHIEPMQSLQRVFEA